MRNATTRCSPGVASLTSSGTARSLDPAIISDHASPSQSRLDLSDISAIVGGVFGRHDVACPICGPTRQSPINRRRRVLRIWHINLGFATYCCRRCGVGGYVADHRAAMLDPARIERAKSLAANLQRRDEIESRKRARWLWQQRQPIIGSVAETYLRQCRGYTGVMPGTLGFLPARGEHPPAMVAAFGVATEIEPGEIIIQDSEVTGVHITRLKPNGSGKAGTEADKIMIGRGHSSPIMLAPPNDLLGLAITEGIEDALSMHAATGLGAWAAGSAGRMPGLAEMVPDDIESVTIAVDQDDVGITNAVELAARLQRRGIEVRMAGGSHEDR